MATITLRCSDEGKAQAEWAAGVLDLTVSQMVRRALRQYVLQAQGQAEMPAELMSSKPKANAAVKGADKWAAIVAADRKKGR